MEGEVYMCLSDPWVPIVRHGLVVRIAGFHPAGPGSIPGGGTPFFTVHVLT